MLSFQEELQKYIDKIEKGDHFSLVRIGDGEQMLVNNIAFTGQAKLQDKRESKGVETKLGNDLRQIFDIDSKDFIYGVACADCNKRVKEWTLNTLKTKTNITFANLRINKNYNTFRKRIENTKLEFHIIANYEGLDKQYPFKVKGYFPLPDDCIIRYDKNKDEYIKALKKLARKNNNQIFLFAGGPLAKIGIRIMYKENKNNTYLDIGSGLDIYTKNRITRGYVRQNDMYSNKDCIF